MIEVSSSYLRHTIILVDPFPEMALMGKGESILCKIFCKKKSEINVYEAYKKGLDDAFEHISKFKLYMEEK